jgi:hypothetical protein
VRALDEDRIALAHVEHRDPGDARRTSHRDRSDQRDGHDQTERRQPECAGPGVWVRRSRLHGDGCSAPGSRSRPPRRQRDDQRPTSDAERGADRRLDLDARQGHRSRNVDDPDDRSQGNPARCREDRAERFGEADRHQRAACHGQQTRRHRRRDERHHEQIDERRDQGEAPERREDNRQCRELCGQRYAEALGQPARQMTARPSIEAPRERRRPRDQAPRREARQLEAGVPDQRGIGEQQQGRRPAERRGGPAGPTRFAGQEHDPGHRACPEHRRRRSGEHDVARDRDRGDDGATSPTKAPGDRGDGRGHDRDVPARDRHDMAHAGRRERRGHVPVHPIAQPDQDPCRETCLGFGQDARQDGPGFAAQPFQAGCRVSRTMDELQRPGVDGPPRSEPLEICAVWAVGSGPCPPPDVDDVASFDRGIAR